MRFGVVTTSYPRFDEDPAGGFVRGLNRFLVHRGHTVEVIAAGEQDDPAQTTAPGLPDRDGIWIRRVPSGLFYKGGAPDALAHGGAAGIADALRFSGRLFTACAQQVRRCDALISHWLVPCGVAAALCAGDRPHVAIAHSSDVHLLRRLRLTGLGRWLGRRAQLVYTSASLQLAGAPGRVVPMGVAVGEFAATPERRAAARRELGVTAKTVLALGRLVPVKGLEGLLAALGQLSGVDLLIAGDGPLRWTLERAAGPLGPRVRFLGEVHGELRRRLLHGCDALVLPSRVLPDGRTESAPTVLLEALAAGSPIVATAVGGVAELVGDAGLVVPPDDPAALAAALQQILFIPGVAAALSQKARARAAAYDWEAIAPRLLGPQLARAASYTAPQARRSAG